MINYWTNKEDRIIIEEYPTVGPSVVIKLPGRSRGATQKRASHLGIKTVLVGKGGLGKAPWNKGLTKETDERVLRYTEKATPARKGRVPWSRGKRLDYMRGENNPNWSGGKYATERNRLMARHEYKEWRIAVFERDDYTCRLCNKRGGDLEADHIKPFYTNPELALVLDNGRTLCIPCHKSLDTWGHKVKTQYRGE